MNKGATVPFYVYEESAVMAERERKMLVASLVVVSCVAIFGLIRAKTRR